MTYQVTDQRSMAFRRMEDAIVYFDPFQVVANRVPLRGVKAAIWNWAR